MSIRLRIAILTALVLAVGVAISSALVSLRLKSQLTDMVSRRAVWEAKQTARMVQPFYGSMRNIKAKSIVRDLLGGETLGVAIADPTGRVVTLRGLPPSAAVETIIRETVATGKPVRGPVGATTSAAAPIKTPDGSVVGEAVVVMDTQYVPEALETINATAIKAGIIATTFGLILAYLLTSIMTKPLHNLLHALRRVESGEYDISVPAAASPELRQVVRTFNEMSASVKRRVGNLEQLNTLAVGATVATRMSEIGKLANAAAMASLSARARLWVFNARTEALESVPAEGVGGRIRPGPRCPVTIAARESRIIKIGKDGDLPPGTAMASDLEPVEAGIIVPLITSEGTVGALSIESVDAGRLLSDDDYTLAIAIANVVGPAVAAHLRTESQARSARLLQRVLVPDPPAEMPGVQVAAWYQPAEEISQMGGDYYDFIKLSDHEWYITIGDVSGKGLPAAEYTAMAKYVLRSYALESKSPAQTLSRTNHSLAAQMRPEAFITVFCAILDTNTRELRYANAGHPRPIIFPASGPPRELAATGVAAGLFDDAGYQESTDHLDSGDTLILFTDGLSEARDGNAFYEDAQMMSDLKECSQLPAADLARCLAGKVKDFSGGKIRDDVAVMVVKAL